MIHNLNPGIQIDAAAWNATMFRLGATYGQMVVGPSRHDGAVTLAADGVDEYRVDSDEKLIEELRVDAQFDQPAAALSRQLEHVRQKIFEEKRVPLSSFDHFAIDSSVPLTAKTYTTRRALGNGEATPYAPGSRNFGSARTGIVESTSRTQIYVCAVESNEIDMLRSNFADTRQYANDLALADRLVREAMNRDAWQGNNAAQISGIFNQPSLAKVQLSVTFQRGADADLMLHALQQAANIALIRSGGAFQPDAMLVSPAIWAIIGSTRLGDTADTTIAEFFIRTQPPGGIRSIQMAPELKNAGGAGVDGIFCYASSTDSTAHVVPQLPTVLPVYKTSPLDSITVVLGCTGGIEMVNVGNNLLAFAEVR